MLAANIKFLDVKDDEIRFSSVKSDYIDKEIFNDVMKDADKLRQIIHKRNEKTPFFEKLSEDLFNALYKVAPKVYNKANVAVSLKVENELLNILISNDNFNKLRKNTAFDLFNSTYALSMFLDKAYKIIEDWTKKSEENMLIMCSINTAIKFQEQLRDINEQLMYDPDDKLLIEQMIDLKNLINQANKNIMNSQKIMDHNMLDIRKVVTDDNDMLDVRKVMYDDNDMLDVRKVVTDDNDMLDVRKVMYDDNDMLDVRKVMADDNDILDVQKVMNFDNKTLDIKDLGCSLKEVLTATEKKLNDDCILFNVFFTLPKYPGNEEGRFQMVSYEEKIEFAKILTKSSTMKRISKKLGKMKTFIGNINKKPSKYGCTITGVGSGNNINRILSSEKALLSDNDLENQFYKKYLNKTLLQYEVQGEDEINGPIIVCVDNSESMKGDKDYFAKATAIAMLFLAVLEKRPYRCILFDNSVNYVVDFQKNEYDFKKVIELAGIFYGGGTEFEPPLKKAVETIDDCKFKKADILFITDGEPVKFLSEKFKLKLEDIKKKRKLLIQGIIIGTSKDVYMKEFCDHIIRFEDLINEEELVNIFNNIK